MFIVYERLTAEAALKVQNTLCSEEVPSVATSSPGGVPELFRASGAADCAHDGAGRSIL